MTKLNRQTPLTKLLFAALTVLCLTSTFDSYADTVDVWTVKRNGKIIINSNQTEILYGNHPMQIHLASFANTDTLQIVYWTDRWTSWKNIKNKTLADLRDQLLNTKVKL